MKQTPSAEVATTYFSRDFPKDVEVEWKASLDTFYPTGFIVWLEDQLRQKQMPPFERTKSLGNRSIAMAYQSLIHHYYGHRSGDGELLQAFVLVQVPGYELFAPHIKFDAGVSSAGQVDHVLQRKESKPGMRSFRPMAHKDTFLDEFRRSSGVEVEYIGSMQRERTSTFATNSHTYRNWSIVADHTRPLDGDSVGMAQVEVEYKGRSGVWSEQNPAYQLDALHELQTFGNEIVQRSGIVHPTRQTKFDWLKDYYENRSSF